jgi:hypothetical protein
MTGRWVIEEHTTSMALGAEQRKTAWSYVDVTQRGETFTIDRGLPCGYVITGTTTVTLPDATLQALALQDSVGAGRRGRFAPTSDGQRCDFALDRMYHLRGAHRHLYLLDHWRVGDPPRPLTEFPPLPEAPPGMEDWDLDLMDGFTQRTGLGDRYIAQRDWSEHAGAADRFATRFGGEGAVTVRWDSQEAVSDQTPVLLRTVATPHGDGWARYVRADDLDVAGGELATCRLVQARARATWPPLARAR